MHNKAHQHGPLQALWYLSGQRRRKNTRRKLTGHKLYRNARVINKNLDSEVRSRLWH